MFALLSADRRKEGGPLDRSGVLAEPPQLAKLSSLAIPRSVTTEDKRHEASLERRGDYCRAPIRRTRSGPAFRPRPRRTDRYGPGRHSSWGAGPLVFAFQPARRLSGSGNTLVDGPRASLLRTPSVLCSALLCATA